MDHRHHLQMAGRAGLGATNGHHELVKPDWLRGRIVDRVEGHGLFVWSSPSTGAKAQPRAPSRHRADGVLPAFVIANILFHFRFQPLNDMAGPSTGSIGVATGP